MDLETAQALTLPETLAVLDGTRYDGRDALAASQRLRAAGHSPALTAALLTQASLRARGRAKLGDVVDRLLLTSDGLEQATRPAVAREHARRLVDAGAERVLDLGCGLGLDALAMAEAGLAVEAVERDEVTAVLAAHNLATVALRPGQPAPVVRRAEVEALLGPGTGPDGARAEGTGADGTGAGSAVPASGPGGPDDRPRRGSTGPTAVWLDPARRTPGVADVTGRTRRTWRLDDLAPSWDTVQALAGRVPAAGAKLSPAFPHGARPAGVEAQWTSWRGEVLECALWWGDAARLDGRSALVLAPDERHLVTEQDVPADRPGPPAALGAWLHEPDRAVIRAGLVGALEAAGAGAELDDGVGYVTGDADVVVPWARRYRVVDQLPLHAKAIRAYLRERHVGGLTLKKRGVDVDPDVLRRSLRLKGSGTATLVLTRLAGRPVAVHVEPA